MTRHARRRRTPRQALRSIRRRRSGVALARDRIESKAVFHFAPGEPIVSLNDPRRLTPEAVVEYTRREGVRVLAVDDTIDRSFMAETALLARAHGLAILLSCDGFDRAAEVNPILPLVDIFSITVPANAASDAELTGALERIHRRGGPGGPHLEITIWLEDSVDDVIELATWIRDTLDPDLPIHLAGAGEPLLTDARQAAQNVGLSHVYVAGASTHCACGHDLVRRDDRNTTRGFDADGWCTGCGAAVPFVLPWPETDSGAFVEHSFRGAPHALSVELPWRGNLTAVWLDARGEIIERQALNGRRFVLRHPTATQVRLHHPPGQPPSLSRIRTAPPVAIAAPRLETVAA